MFKFQGLPRLLSHVCERQSSFILSQRLTKLQSLPIYETSGKRSERKRKWFSCGFQIKALGNLHTNFYGFDIAETLLFLFESDEGCDFYILVTFVWNVNRNFPLNISLAARARSKCIVVLFPFLQPLSRNKTLVWRSDPQRLMHEMKSGISEFTALRTARWDATSSHYDYDSFRLSFLEVFSWNIFLKCMNDWLAVKIIESVSALFYNSLQCNSSWRMKFSS